MRVYGVIFEDEDGEFTLAQSQGSSTATESKIFETAEKAERSRRQLARRPHYKDKALLLGVFELQSASETIEEVNQIKEYEDYEIF